MIIIFWAFLPDDDRAYAIDPMQKLCHNFQGVSKIRFSIFPIIWAKSVR